MKGIIFIENNKQNTLLSDLKKYITTKFHPADFTITANEGLFRKYLDVDSYRNIIVIVESDILFHYLKSLVYEKDLILQKMTIISVNVTTVAVTTWQGSHRFQRTNRVISKQDFAIKFEEFSEEFFEEIPTPSKDYFIVNAIGKGLTKVLLNEIIFMQGGGYNTIIYLTSNQLLKVKFSQKKILSFLPNNFIKIHKSYSINATHGFEWKDGKVVLKNGYTLPTIKSEAELTATLGVL